VIDFRYHLVSIIAVFLALAIGIIVGSTALQPAVESGLNTAEQQVQKKINADNNEIGILNQRLKLDQQFAQAGGTPLIGRLLTGQSVVLVLAPGADGQVVTGMTAAIQQAGGTVTGQVTLQPQFFDNSESTEGKLTQLTQTLAGNTGLTLSRQRPGGSRPAHRRRRRRQGRRRPDRAAGAEHPGRLRPGQLPPGQPPERKHHHPAVRHSGGRGDPRNTARHRRLQSR
jgi:type IV secretory pathway VirB2 component (pilin)